MSPLRLPRGSNWPYILLALVLPPKRSAVAIRSREIGPYLVLVGKVAQDTRDQTHVDEREHGMAWGPAPVLVTVGIEFYRSVSFCRGYVVGPGCRFKETVAKSLYFCQTRTMRKFDPES